MIEYADRHVGEIPPFEEFDPDQVEKLEQAAEDAEFVRDLLKDV